MPATRVFQDQLNLDSPICFTGTVIPTELSSLITNDYDSKLIDDALIYPLDNTVPSAEK